MEFPLISVIVPVFNCSPFLDRLFYSLIFQSYSKLELLIIDDGSTDDSFEIIKKWESTDSRIKSFRQINQGLSKTRNFGIDHSSGKYVAFIDGDDYVDLDYFEKLLYNIETTGAEIAMTSTKYYVDEKYRGILPPNYTEVATTMFSKIAILRGGGCCDKLFSREFLLKYNLRFPENRNYEGNIFLLKAMYYSNKFSFSPDSFYHYCRRKNSICTTTDPIQIKKKLDDRCYILREMCLFIKEKNFSKRDKNRTYKFICSSVFDEPDIYNSEMDVIFKYLGLYIINKVGIRLFF